MKYSRTDFHRRNFLRASGVAVALPLFESRVQATTHSPEVVPDSAAESPQRMVCIGNPYGMIPDDFFPTESGPKYTLPKLLKPLERHRDEFTVFSNFDHGYTGGHRVVDTFLTGIKTIDARASVTAIFRSINWLRNSWGLRPDSRPSTSGWGVAAKCAGPGLESTCRS